jgi:hypothetical protein
MNHEMDGIDPDGDSRLEDPPRGMTQNDNRKR